MSESPHPIGDALAAPAWFGQPRGLTILFLTEMWEKFSYFGMRAILVFYMVRELGFPQSRASLIYGTYTAFVYFTPLIGGAISDRWLSRRTAVIFGGSVMALGHLMMTFPSLLIPALATIAIGNGFYLPNLPSQIGSLYGDDDPRRGGAFNVYYVGVNLGAFLAPLVCGTLGEMFGWHYGFAAAGAGMIIGLTIYVIGQPLLPQATTTSRKQVHRTESATSTQFRTLLAVGLAVLIFRIAYEQIGNTVALWAQSDVDRTIGSFIIPASWFQSLNALLVFALTPLIVAGWAAAARKGRAPSSLEKMAFGAAGLAASYLLLGLVVRLSAGGMPSWVWLFAFVTGLTLAELYILPVGLGLFARLAPQRLGATTIASWFLAAFGGNLLAGWLGSFWTYWPHDLFFLVVAGISALAGAVLWTIERSAWPRIHLREPMS